MMIKISVESGQHDRHVHFSSHEGNVQQKSSPKKSVTKQTSEVELRPTHFVLKCFFDCVLVVCSCFDSGATHLKLGEHALNDCCWISSKHA